MSSKYWQYEHPERCPKRHKMGWLGGAFWICDKCKPKCIYVVTYKAED